MPIQNLQLLLLIMAAENKDEKMTPPSEALAPLDFDYVRFTWPDLHGISRSKLVPRRNVSCMWDQGVHVFEGKPG